MEEQKEKFALFSFLTALVSAPMIFVPCCNLFALIGLPIALILGILGLKAQKNKWMAIIAIVISVVLFGLQIAGVAFILSGENLDIAI